MKRLISVLLILILVFALSSCGAFAKNKTLSIGVSETLGDGSITESVAAIITESDGTVSFCRLDSVTYIPEIDAYGTPIVTTPTPLSESSGNEYAQIKFFENYLTGKTVAEILAIELNSDGAFKDSTLYSSCQLYIKGYIEAIEKASKNYYKTSFRAHGIDSCAVALTVEPEASKTEALTDFTLTGSFAAVAESDGKIAAAIIDANEVILTAEKNTDGSVRITAKESKGTKLEQGESYGMDDYNPYAIGEWYEQAGAYVYDVVGIGVNGLETELPEGAAGCTIYIGSYKSALLEAASKLR